MHVAPPNGSPQQRDAAQSPWRHQRVHLVHHQHISVDHPQMLRSLVTEQREVAAILRPVEQSGSAVDAARDEILRNVWNAIAFLAGHLGNSFLPDDIRTDVVSLYIPQRNSQAIFGRPVPASIKGSDPLNPFEDTVPPKRILPDFTDCGGLSPCKRRF
jgi:hypothetical protein